MDVAGYTIVVFMSIIFIAAGFIDQRKTMHFSSLDESLHESYLRSFKWFHVFLGITLLIGGVIMVKYGSAFQWIFFCVYYPLLMYLVAFIVGGKKFNFNRETKYYWTIAIIVAVLILVSTMFLKGNTENLLIADQAGIEITEMYGEYIPRERIKSFAIVATYPDLTLRVKGYDDGKVQKGYFKNRSDELVKIVANKKQGPLILITTTDDEKIYYVPEHKSAEDIFRELQIVYPGIPSFIQKED